MTKFKYNDNNYFADKAYSQSDLKTVLESPWLLWVNKHNGGMRKRPTPPMISGTIDHAAVLEPERFAKEYVVCKARNTTAGKQEVADAIQAGHNPITSAQHAEALGVARSIREHPWASALFKDGQPEVSVYGEDLATGLAIKGRLDWFDGDTVVDLKTVGNGGASKKSFTNAIGKYRYHLQAAHYLTISQAKRFVFVAVEREFPYQVGVYELDQDAIDEGMFLRKTALETVAFCVASGQWPGYTPNQIETISLPTWAYSS